MGGLEWQKLSHDDHSLQTSSDNSLPKECGGSTTWCANSILWRLRWRWHWQDTFRYGASSQARSVGCGQDLTALAWRKHCLAFLLLVVTGDGPVVNGRVAVEHHLAVCKNADLPSKARHWPTSPAPNGRHCGCRRLFFIARFYCIMRRPIVCGLWLCHWLCHDRRRLIAAVDLAVRC